MVCGIYCIKNVKNGKVYVGQSVKIEKRFAKHKRELNKNEHWIKELQKDWNDNETDFEFLIIELCEKNELNDKERYWISYYRKNGSVYNLSDGGRGPCDYKWSESHRAHEKIGMIGRNPSMKGRKFSEEHRRKISEALKGRPGIYYGKDHPLSRPVRSLTTGKEYECANDAGKDCGSHSTYPGANILSCCAGRRKKAYGQEWEYINK